MKTRLTGVAFALTVVAAVYLLVCPTYSGFLHGRHTHATALEVNGPYVLIPILFPALTALIPLLFRKQAWRVMATILIWGFALLGGFTSRLCGT
ncbi:MAG TPA: NAD(P)H-quinone oxidoreductase subunit L [Bryobacteraceae bacterium]|nr:NAD(P)H-quinone oxidoreductase subunit L [Bryobacteraceae bacterium]